MLDDGRDATLSIPEAQAELAVITQATKIEFNNLKVFFLHRLFQTEKAM